MHIPDPRPREDRKTVLYMSRSTKDSAMRNGGRKVRPLTLWPRGQWLARHGGCEGPMAAVGGPAARQLGMLAPCYAGLVPCPVLAVLTIKEVIVNGAVSADQKL